MKRRVHLVIFGAAIAVAAVAAITVPALSNTPIGQEPSDKVSRGATQSHDRGTDPGGAVLRSELNAVQGTVQQLARTQANLQRELDRSAEQRAATEAGPAAAAESAGVEPDDPTAPDREASKLASRCDEAIIGQPVDPEWSRAKNERFGAFFARPPLSGTRLKSVDCRTTMCRIDLTHRSKEDRTRFIQSFSDLAGPTGMVFAHIETADDLDIAVYVTRDGVALP
jgi:hypothetical protein